MTLAYRERPSAGSTAGPIAVLRRHKNEERVAVLPVDAEIIVARARFGSLEVDLRDTRYHAWGRASVGRHHILALEKIMDDAAAKRVPRGPSRRHRASLFNKQEG